MEISSSSGGYSSDGAGVTLDTAKDVIEFEFTFIVCTTETTIEIDVKNIVDDTNNTNKQAVSTYIKNNLFINIYKRFYNWFRYYFSY